MKPNETETTVRGLRRFVPSRAVLAWAALIAAMWLVSRNNGPCHCSVDRLAGRPVVNDSSQRASQDDANTFPTTATPAAQTAEVAATTAPSDGTSNGLPRLLDLGAGKCIPCKMMAPILDELKEQYADSIEVEFVDVWQRPEEAKKHGVETIPTQIFFDASGKERFRHVGFFSKEEILAKWKELGVNLNPRNAVR